MSKRPVPRDQRNALDMLRRGHTAGMTAFSVGVSERTVRKWAKKHGVKLRQGRPPKAKADPAIWVDGSDSEAARAVRPKRCCGGNRKPGHEPGCDLYEPPEPDPDYRAMWEELERAVPLVGDISAGALRGCMAGVLERHKREARTPDPGHVPAVRRVVAWVGNDEEWPRTDIADAYMDAAHQLLVRAHVRRGCSWERIERWWPEWRIQCLAAWLRHRDEKAGWR